MEEPIASEAGISRAAAAATEMHSEEGRAATADRVPDPAAAAALPVWDLVVEVGAVVAAVVGAAGR